MDTPEPSNHPNGNRGSVLSQQMSRDNLQPSAHSRAEEIHQIITDHAEELQDLRKEHAQDLSSATDQIRAKDADIERLNSVIEARNDTVLKRNIIITRLRQQHQEKIARSRTEHNTAILRLTERQNTAVQRFGQQHAVEVKALEERIQRGTRTLGYDWDRGLVRTTVSLHSCRKAPSH